MTFQSPLVSIPRKTTTDVDWTGPIRAIIANSYGESPSAYVEECSVLQRCRQDAVKGAGSDATARDLLYKYFGQLELLELRFAEIKVPFPWNDAFTLKQTTQTSLAFEKASIIHLLSAVLSSLAATGSRADPEGVKRAYFNSRAAAGMLTYINENFLHAPSTDLSREVVHFLIGIMMAQATEVFTEKLVSEKKAPALVCRSANQAAGMYSILVDEMKEFQGKGIFDRNWLHVLQIKAKLFGSAAQYYRSTADSGGGKHGSGLVRMKLADSLAQETQRLANSFSYTFVSSSTPSLPHDAATCLLEITKAHATLCSEAKAQALRDNDLIYHDILPSEASLPSIEKLPVAAPITIQEVYSNPEVSKLIGPDIFVRLVPLAVHESASIYSEEKAKLVRAEVERVDLSEGEIRAGLEHLGLPGAVADWRRLVSDDQAGDTEVELSGQMRRLVDDIQHGGSIERLIADLDRERETCERDLRELNSLLEGESRDCERMRAKYAPQFTQSPSGSRTAHLRSTITSNLDSLSAARSSDAQVTQLWQEIQPKVAALSQGESSLRATATQIANGKPVVSETQAGSLLDLQDEDEPKTGLDPTEKEQLQQSIEEAREKLDRLGKIRRERDDVLKDLKEKIQNDDVSSLLLLNRRSSNVEPQLFASELEKFRPYQGRLTAAIQASNGILTELESVLQRVEKGKGVRDRQRGQKDRQKRLRDWERSLETTGEQFSEVRAGFGKGLSYYESLQVVIRDIGGEVREFVRSREVERNRMVSEIETRQRIGGGSTSPMGDHSRNLESSLAGLSIARSPYASPPPPPQSMKPMAPTPASMPTPPAHPSTPSYAPPPPSRQAPETTPYDFSNLGSLPSAFSSPLPSHPAYAPPAPHSSSQPRQPSYPSTYASQPSSNPYPPPPARPTHSYQPPAYPAPPTRQFSGSYPAPSQHSSPPPPQSYPSYQPPPQNHYSAPPQPQYQPPQHGGYPGGPPPSMPPQQSPQYPQQPYSGYTSPPPPGQYGQHQQQPNNYQYR